MNDKPSVKTTWVRVHPSEDGVPMTVARMRLLVLALHGKYGPKSQRAKNLADELLELAKKYGDASLKHRTIERK